MTALARKSCSLSTVLRTVVNKYKYLTSSFLHSSFHESIHQSETSTTDIEIVARDVKAELINHDTLVKYMVKRTDAKIDPGSIFENKPNLKRTLKGRKQKIRTVWEEQDCSSSFPSSPEEANLDLLQYLEQRDLWERRQVIEIPKFCIGSIVAVTRADKYAVEGISRFVGLCIHKNFYQNTKRAYFVLRNVIANEALEIKYPTYSPMIQKIEVLKHERWEKEDEENGLLFLRDFPPEYSTVSQTMLADEYTEEPSVRKWTNDDSVNIKKWFDAIFESRKRK